MLPWDRSHFERNRNVRRANSMWTYVADANIT